MTRTQTYTRNNPFLASITERYALSKPGSQKNTHHITLCLKGSNIEYVAGDCIGVLPHNDPDVVENTIKAMQATGDERIVDSHGAETSLYTFLYYKANITEFSRKLLSELAERHTDDSKKAHLLHLLKPESKVELKDYQSRYDLWKLLELHQEAKFIPQELCKLLMPLLPRLYSIASSQKMVNDEVHLTVALVKYESDGALRKGVATTYLSHHAPVNKGVVPIYIQPHHGFTIPENHDLPIIMIGPGTGVAPFRAFMQERLAHDAKGNNWLFFGECNRHYDFFYEDFWSQLEREGKLKLSTAFSRDQRDKVYVQHKMLEEAAEIYRWLEQGAHLYVCGDANRMAKDVEATLHQIIQQQAGINEEDARAYVKKLRHDKRYMKDVY